MIYMSDVYQATAELSGCPTIQSRILWDNLLAAATFSATSSREGFAAARAQSADTVSWWWPSAGGTLTAALPAAREIDCIAIAAHTIGSAGVTLTAQAQIGGSWVTVYPAFKPTDDEPIMIAFARQLVTGVRLVLSASARVGVLMAGPMLEMPQPAYNSLPPLSLIRSTAYETNRSETGQIMGRSIASTSRPFEASWSHLKEAWVRETFAPFARAARTDPFFIALRPSRQPEDVGYALSSGDIKPERMGVRDYMQIQISAEAHAGPEG